MLKNTLELQFSSPAARPKNFPWNFHDSTKSQYWAQVHPQYVPVPSLAGFCVEFVGTIPESGILFS